VSFWNVVSGVAWRTLKNALTNPQIFLPTMLFPLFFFTAFAGGDVDRARLTRPLGQPWEIHRQMVKPHACCAHAFGAIDATVELMRSRPFDPATVDHIEVSTYDAAAVLTDREPADPVAARLSIPWCVAQAALHPGAPGLLGTGAFTHEALADPVARAIAAKVEVLGSEESDAVFPAQRRTRVEVVGHGGAEVRTPRGMPDNPVSVAALRRKAHALVDEVLGAEAADELEGLVAEMCTVPRWAEAVHTVLIGAGPAPRP
jgi:2-methylcitrate dehydratase PrpD